MELFEEVAEAVRGLVDGSAGPMRHRTHRYGTKIWFGDPEPPREHYEAQVIGAGQVPEAEVLALEIGFHAEHRKEADNVAALEPLLATEAEWRAELGDEPVAGTFLGRDGWRRLSETWADPDLDDPELGTELALTLVAYVTAIEPRRSRPG
ncbi:MAG: hypothetical protein AAGK32_15620 [Actinomycetota bacterium]